MSYDYSIFVFYSSELKIHFNNIKETFKDLKTNNSIWSLILIEIKTMNFTF